MSVTAAFETVFKRIVSFAVRPASPCRLVALSVENSPSIAAWAPIGVKIRKIERTTRIIFRNQLQPNKLTNFSTTGNDTWWNAYSAPSQRRCVFTQPGPEADLAQFSRVASFFLR
jgi:hypothetical protein